MRPLLEPREMPSIADVRIPREFYWVVDQPASLAGMPSPRPHMPWPALYQAGFHHVICLTTTQPGYRPDPLHIAFAAELEDLVSGGPPKDPAQQERLVREAVQIALTNLNAGDGVVIHCAGGRGRTGTVIGCTLRALGYSAEEIIQYLDRLHKARGKAGWPESQWQSALVRRFQE